MNGLSAAPDQLWTACTNVTGKAMDSTTSQRAESTKDHVLRVCLCGAFTQLDGTHGNYVTFWLNAQAGQSSRGLTQDRPASPPAAADLTREPGSGGAGSAPAVSGAELAL